MAGSFCNARLGKRYWDGVQVGVDEARSDGCLGKGRG